MTKKDWNVIISRMTKNRELVGDDTVINARLHLTNGDIIDCEIEQDGNDNEDCFATVFVEENTYIIPIDIILYFEVL